jgi:hypothetical protein
MCMHIKDLTSTPWSYRCTWHQLWRFRMGYITATLRLGGPVCMQRRPSHEQRRHRSISRQSSARSWPTRCDANTQSWCVVGTCSAAYEYGVQLTGCCSGAFGSVWRVLSWVGFPSCASCVIHAWYIYIYIYIYIHTYVYIYMHIMYYMLLAHVGMHFRLEKNMYIMWLCKFIGTQAHIIHTHTYMLIPHYMYGSSRGDIYIHTHHTFIGTQAHITFLQHTWFGSFCEKRHTYIHAHTHTY